VKSISDDVTFVTNVVGIGVFNGVVNLSLATFLFTPSDDGKTVEPDPAISCRIRMDEACAAQLRDMLTRQLESIEKGRQDQARIAHNGSDESAERAKPN
jgi:hypothetical protein